MFIQFLVKLLFSRLLGACFPSFIFLRNAVFAEHLLVEGVLNLHDQEHEQQLPGLFGHLCLCRNLIAEWRQAVEHGTLEQQPVLGVKMDRLETDVSSTDVLCQSHKVAAKNGQARKAGKPTDSRDYCQTDSAKLAANQLAVQVPIIHGLCAHHLQVAVLC